MHFSISVELVSCELIQMRVRLHNALGLRVIVSVCVCVCECVCMCVCVYGHDSFHLCDSKDEQLLFPAGACLSVCLS